MNDEWNEEVIQKLRQELLWTRIFSILSSLLMVCLLIGGGLLFQKYQENKKQIETYAIQVREYVEELTSEEGGVTKVDIVAFNEALINMNNVIEAVDWNMLNDSIASVDWNMLSDSIASVDWTKVSKQLEELDVEAINQAIEDLDTKELTKALENMNSAIEKLRSIADAFSAFASKLGFGIS